VDTEEMYRRGVADAEQGELHPFFYEHYYHYRRGYDETRRRLRWSSAPARLRSLLWVAPILLGIVLAGGYGASALLGRQPAPTPVATLSAPPTERAAPTATRTPIFPTATTAPTPTPLALRAGARARVVGTGGRPLRGREAPGLNAPARVAFAEGEEVQLLEGPVEADGYTWWRIEGPSGVGWSAQGSPEGAEWLAPIAD
jgi:hypothetical protein